MQYKQFGNIQISYKKLWLFLSERYISKAMLRTDLKLSTRTMAKLNKSEAVTVSALVRICQYLHCDIVDIGFAIFRKKRIY